MLSMGSSPRMRGSRGLLFDCRLGIGIIPAHAGLTLGNRLMAQYQQDHPRACGAHDQSVERGWQGVGSSPRMRGSQDALPSALDRLGIIPAHAGLTMATRKQR